MWLNSIHSESEYEGRVAVFGEAKRICESRGSKLISINEIINSTITFKLFE